MLAIPRDAICMAEIIADVLQGELDVVLVHKPGAPRQPQLAIRALDEAGNVFLSGYGLDIDDSYLEVEKQAQLEVLRKRRARYTPPRGAIDTMTVSSSWSTIASRGTVLLGFFTRANPKL